MFSPIAEMPECRQWTTPWCWRWYSQTSSPPSPCWHPVPAPTSITPSGQPLLHLALALDEGSHDLAMVQLLLINGANPECKNLQGRTALDMAREEEFKLLVGFGAEGGSSFIHYISA